MIKLIKMNNIIPVRVLDGSATKNNTHASSILDALIELIDIDGLLISGPSNNEDNHICGPAGCGLAVQEGVQGVLQLVLANLVQQLVQQGLVL